MTDIVGKDKGYLWRYELGVVGEVQKTGVFT